MNQKTGSFSQKEYKTFDFDVLETKEVERQGQLYGIVKGYASTYGNVDRGNDRILQGAFQKSLERYRQTGRPIKMYYQHDSKDIIGGFPIEKIQDEARGLYVEGEINLDVQRGRESYALAKQGVMQDFSIGYTIQDYDMKDGVRELKEIELWEVSIVGEPMNTQAQILNVKTVTPFQDLPLAPLDTEWTAEKALERVRDFTKSSDSPSKDYRKAFMYYMGDRTKDITAYKLPYADVINGELKAIPRALFSIAASLNGARGGIDIPESDAARIKAHVTRYYEAMDMDSPFQKTFFSIQDVEPIKTKKEFEKALRESGAFSRQASVYLASRFDESKQSESETNSQSLNEENILALKSLIAEFKQRLKNDTN